MSIVVINNGNTYINCKFIQNNALPEADKGNWLGKIWKGLLTLSKVVAFCLGVHIN